MLKKFADVLSCRPLDWDQIIAFAFPVLLAGMAIGVMLMAVAQRYAKRCKRTEFERLGNSIGGAIPSRRWNGRYPSDAERRP